MLNHISPSNIREQRLYDRGLRDGQRQMMRAVDAYFNEETARAPNGKARDFQMAVWHRVGQRMNKAFSHSARVTVLASLGSAFLNGVVGALVVLAAVLLGWL